MYKLKLLIVLISLLQAQGSCYASDNSYNRYYITISQYIENNSIVNKEWGHWITISILELSAKYQVDPLLITANIAVESNFKVDAISDMNAIGLSQLTENTANMLGVDPYDPSQNLEGGVRYIKQLLLQFKGSGEWTESLAIAAYNSGPGAVLQYRGIPPYEETINHVNKVATIYKKLESRL